MNIDGQGSRHNGGKIEFHTIPPQFMAELARLCTYGEIKYPSDDNGQPNWTRGMLYTKVLNCLHRHLLMFESGESYDDELFIHHMVQVAWNAMVLYHYDVTGQYIEFDDRVYAAYETNKYLDKDIVDKLRANYKNDK